MRKKRQRIRVAVIVGGPSSEHDVSLSSGAMVMRSLDTKKYDARLVVIGRDLRWAFPEASTAVSLGEALVRLAKDRYDVAFPVMHGAFGEDGTLQAILEAAGLPYTGSPVLANALAMDKFRSAQIFVAEGIHTPENILVPKETKKSDFPKYISLVRRNFGFPCVVKPRYGGSSIGVALPNDSAELSEALSAVFSLGEDALLEERIVGREVTCGVLDVAAKEGPQALPVTEILPKGSTFFDFSAKYTAGATDEITPANLSAPLTANIQKTALAAHRALGCRGFSRTDMIVRGKEVFVLETNTIPGMTETSLYPQAAAVCGIPFPKLLDLFLRDALSRNRV